MSLNPNASLPLEKIPPEGKEYRVSRMYLVISIVGLLFFTAMGTYTFYAAWTNMDNSFPNPVADAIVFGGGWIIPALASIWSMVFCIRGRLFVDPGGVRIKGIFRTREVRFNEVNRAAWKISGRAGKLVLYDPSGKVAVEFGSYASNQNELMRYFVLALAGHDQKDWERFAEFYNVNRQPMRAAPHESEQAQADVARPDSGQFSPNQSASPVMTRAEYEMLADRTSKSMRRGYIGVWSFTTVILLVISVVVSPRYGPGLKQQINSLYQHFPGIPHAAIAVVIGLIIAGAGFGGPLVYNFYVYRFGGLRCPRCHRNMTYRRKTEVVLHRGECPFCHEKLFKEDER
jgi:hypothetical protein